MALSARETRLRVATDIDLKRRIRGQRGSLRRAFSTPWQLHALNRRRDHAFPGTGMNRQLEFWSARLCCAALAFAISASIAIAQTGRSVGDSAPVIRSQSAQEAASVSGIALPPASLGSDATGPSLSAGGIGLAATANSNHQTATTDRPATPLAPRSSLGLVDRGSAGNADDQSGGFGSILIALGFVIVLMLGVAKVVQRRNPFAVTGVPREAIDVLGRRTVDPRNSIYIVRVGPKILLLGNSANGLTTLSEIDDPIEVAALSNQCRAASESPPTDLITWFKGLIGRRSTRGEVRSFEDRFGERLVTDAQNGEAGTVTSVEVGRRQEARRV